MSAGERIHEQRFISKKSMSCNLNQSIYPTPLIYVLHSFQGHLDECQLFIFILKVLRDFSAFIKSGTRAHIFGPKCAKVSVPYFAVCVFLVLNLFFEQYLMFSFIGNTRDMITGESPFITS